MSKAIGDIDDYVCTVSQEILEIAKNELREDENIREQSLEIFRSWILKHEDILKCRLGSSFLLRFLRQKKYSIPLAQEGLMKHLLARSIFPDFYHNLISDCVDPAVKEIFDNGTLMILKGRQDDGKRIVIANYENLDIDHQDLTLLGRAWAIMLDTLMEEESNQITGVVLINNCNGLGVQHLAMYTPRMLQRLLMAFNKTHPVRYSAMHFLGLPSYFEKLFQFLMSIMGKKMRERVIVHSAETKLEEVVPMRILPKEYGGDGLTLDETKKAWNDEILASRSRLLLNSELTIAERYKYQRCKETFPNETLGIDGSFRKLQID